MSVPSWRPSHVIAAMCLAEILSMGGYGSFAALSPTLEHDWKLTTIAIGWVSGSYFAGSTVGTAFLPAATDRCDTRVIYFGSLALSALGLLAFALLVHGPAGAAIARFVQGFGLAGTYFPGLRALLSATPATHHNRATAFYTSLYSVGTSASFLLSGLLDRNYGHRATFALLALGPAVALPIAALALRSVRRGAPDPQARLLAFRPVLRERRLLGHIIAYAALCGQILVLQTWLVILLALSGAGDRASPGVASTIVAAIILCAVPSSILGNELANRYGHVRIIVALMLTSIALFAATFAAAHGQLAAVACLALVTFVATTTNSSSITNSLRAVCPPRLLGRALSVYALAGALAATVAPFAFGVVLDVAGGQASTAEWLWAAIAVGAVFTCGPLALAWLSRPGRSPGEAL
jgi:MFS family permease